jgi:hypothetical protein
MKRRRIDPDLARLTEKQWQTRVDRYARDRGWLTCHVFPGQVAAGRFITTTSAPGFPDWWAVRDGRLLVLEFKTEGAPPSTIKAEQKRWVKALQEVPGVRAYVVRPSDWPRVQRLLDHIPTTEGATS